MDVNRGLYSDPQKIYFEVIRGLLKHFLLYSDPQKSYFEVIRGLLNRFFLGGGQLRGSREFKDWENSFIHLCKVDNDNSQ